MNERIAMAIGSAYSFYDKNLTELHLKIWDSALKGYEPEEVERAFQAHVKDTQRGHWLPKPADIILRLEGDVNERALDSFGRVLRIATAGGFGAEELDDVERKALAVLGGLSAVQRTDESENSFLQKRYVDAYKAYAARKQREEHVVIAGNVRKLIE